MADRAVIVHYGVSGVGRAVAAPNAVADAHVRAFNKINTAAQAKMASTSRAIATMSAFAGKAILLGVGVALVIGAKAAIDFESSMAGVFKTLGDTATTGQIEALGLALREMSLSVPVNVNQLAFIAELGGQLGVGIQDMEQFVKVVAALSVTTNLSAEQAAKGLARLSNIMQLPIEEADKLGNVIVDLGNNFATTESEILSFGLRLAPIGKTVGATADEVLGMAAAFSSLGIPAERGATAIQRTFIDIAKAVDEGGRKLDKFAEIAGITAEQFANLSAVGQFDAFVTGLGRITKEGGSAFKALDSLNISQQRSIQVLLAAAGAGDLFARSIKTASDAAREGNALWEEAARRYGTTSSQIRLLVNTFNDLRIEIGQGLIPLINSVIGFFRDFTAALKNNFVALKIFAGILIAGVVFKALVVLVTGLKAAAVAFAQYRAAMLLATTIAGGFRAAITGVTLALAASQIVLLAAVAAFGAYFFWMARNEGKARKLRDAVRDLNDELDAGGTVAGGFQQLIEGSGNTKVLSFLRAAGIGTFELAKALEATDGKQLEILRQRLRDYGDTIENMPSIKGGLFGTKQDRKPQGVEDALKFIDEFAVIAAARTADAEERAIDAARNAETERLLNLRQFLRTRNDLIHAGEKEAFVSSGVGFFLGDEENFKRWEDFVEAIDEGLVEAQDRVVEFFSDVRDEIFASIVIWDKYPKAVKINVDKVIANLKRQAVDIEKWNETLATLIAMGVNETVINTFDSFDLATKAGITKLMEKSPKAFLKFVEGFEEQFARFDAAAIVKASLFDPIGKEMDIFLQGTLAELAKLGGGDAGFELYVSSILEQLESLGPLGREALIKSIDEMLASGIYDKMFGVSKSALEGMRDGLIQYRSILDGALGGIGDKIESYFLGRFEVSSPSKVFMRIGQQLGEGLHVGLADSIAGGLDGLDRHIGAFRQAALGPTNNQTTTTSTISNQYDLTVNGSTSPQSDAASILLTAQLSGTL